MVTLAEQAVGSAVSSVSGVSGVSGVATRVTTSASGKFGIRVEAPNAPLGLSGEQSDVAAAGRGVAGGRVGLPCELGGFGDSTETNSSYFSLGDNRRRFLPSDMPEVDTDTNLQPAPARRRWSGISHAR